MSKVKHHHVVSPTHKASMTFFADTYETEGAGDREFDSPAKLFRFLSKAPLERDEKKEVPLFSRARCEGRRRKRNLKGPLLLILDIDGVAESIEEISGRLEIMGVDHFINTTWSQATPKKRITTRTSPTGIASSPTSSSPGW